MNFKSLQTGLVILAVLAVAVPAMADDRDLLRSRGAKPNVLMIIDSSGSMTQDSNNPAQSHIASGDGPRSKLTEVKFALNEFFDEQHDFNLGFTFYEREELELHNHVFLYRLDPAGADVQWRWRIRVREDGSIRGQSDNQYEDLDPGEMRRLGPDDSGTGGGYYWDPLFGYRGLEMYSDWSRNSNQYIGGVYVYNNSKQIEFDGTSYTGEYRVNVFLQEPQAGTGHYYPATDWNAAVQTALNDFILIHDAHADTLYDPAATSAQKLMAFQTMADARVILQDVIDLNQIGSPQLTLVQELYECQDTDGGDPAWIRDTTGACEDGTYVLIGTETRNMLTVDGQTPHDLDPADPLDNIAYSGAMVPVDGNSGYDGAFDYGSTCDGYQHVRVDGINQPVLPVPVDEDVGLDNVIRSYLRSQPQMQFYFPTKPSGFIFWPRYWDTNSGAGAFEGHRIFVTDRTLMGAGSTPIANSLYDARNYYRDDVKMRVDDLKNCRSNFVILLTDGLDTCPNDPCYAATALGQINVPVYVIGYGLGTAGNALSCIASNSDGELYQPDNVGDLVQALKNIAQSIEERSRGFAAPMVPSVEVSTEQKAYLATFLPLNLRSVWQGHMRAYAVDPYTGTIPLTPDGFPDTSEALWNVHDKLIATDPDDRKLYYGDDAAGGMPGSRWPFTYPGNSAERDKLKAYMNDTGMTDSDLSDTIDFVRGERDSSLYRGEKLGDVFHGVPGLVSAPECYTCWLTNQHDYRDDLTTPGDAFDGWWGTHLKRRQVLFVPSNDGLLHAIDAGIWDVDEKMYDDGTGNELFAWAPREVMPTYPFLAVGEDHQWTVDGTPSPADVWVDHQFSTTPDFTDREWRSVLLFGERRGGRSYTCLDITQPDTYDSDGIPDPVSGAGNRDAKCTTNITGCSGPWPDFRWEFTDILDDNLDGEPDLGDTWSRPLVAFIRVKVGTDPDAPLEERSVAIFGGGFDKTTELSGRHLYMVDIETGQILVKVESYGMVPSDVAGLDINLDGFLERVYWVDTEGYLYRMDLETAGIVDTVTGRVTTWAAQPIFWAGLDQPFFQRPSLAPVSFSPAGEPYIALGFGAGNRDDIFEQNVTPHDFYMFIDRNDYGSVGTLTPSSMQSITVSSPFANNANYLTDPSLRGWYLILGDIEKVNTPALIINEIVIFSTFRPSDEIVVLPDPDDPNVKLCQRSGDAKTYVIDFFNGNPTDPTTDRYIQHDATVALATDPTVYLGADGKLHIIQALDDLRIVDPIEAQDVNVRAINWKEE